MQANNIWRALAISQLRCIRANNSDILLQGEVKWLQKLILTDSNSNRLEKTASHLGIPDRTECVLADVQELLPIKPEKFNSVSLMYRLHCIPAPPEHKGRVFANLRPFIGILFDATIPGRGVQHN
jgi:hypothetical protein